MLLQSSGAAERPCWAGTISVSGELSGLGVQGGFSSAGRLMVEVFTEQCGHAPHGGGDPRRCGVRPAGRQAFGAGLLCPSAPISAEIHTPRERMHIASVQRTWSFAHGNPPPPAVRNSKSISEAKSTKLSASLFVPGGGAATSYKSFLARTLGEPTPDELSRPLRKRVGCRGSARTGPEYTMAAKHIQCATKNLKKLGNPPIMTLFSQSHCFLPFLRCYNVKKVP